MRSMIVALLAFCVLGGAVARPADDFIVPAEEREAQTLAHQIAVSRALLAVGLTEAQKAALLPLLTERVETLQKIRAAKTAAQPAVEEAMINLRTAVLANNGVSDAVKGAVHRAEAPFKGPEKKLEEFTDPETAAQAWALLTTSQGAALRRLGMAEFVVDNDDAWLKRAAGRFLPRQFQTERGLAIFYRQYGLTGEEITRAAAFGAPIAKEWLALPKPQVVAKRDEYLRKLIALPATGILDAKPDPRTERQLLNTLLTQKALHALNPALPMPNNDIIESPTLKRTVADIRVMNLVNTFYLTPEQTRALIDIQKRADLQYAALDAKRLELTRHSVPLLRQMRDGYARGEQPSLTLVQQVMAIRQERQPLGKEEAKLDAAYLKELRGVLTENQIAMVGNFVPCTVPVQSLTNPERIGQANDTSGMEKSLARLREAPDARLPKGIELLQQNIEKHFKLKGYREEKIQLVLDRVPAIVAEIRAMDDAEFKLKKCELAEELSVPPHIAVGKELDRRIVNYLLSPNLTPILEARIAGK